jgi:erythromycin esterase-like protein
MFHDAGRGDVFLRDEAMPSEALLERAIGVIYRPDTERQSHCFLARLAEQFHAVIHIDTTTAVKPLAEALQGAHQAGPADTYPSGV